MLFLTNNDVSALVGVCDFIERERGHITPLGECNADCFTGVIFVQGVGELGDSEKYTGHDRRWSLKNKEKRVYPVKHHPNLAL